MHLHLREKRAAKVAIYYVERWNAALNFVAERLLILLAQILASSVGIASSSAHMLLDQGSK